MPHANRYSPDDLGRTLREALDFLVPDGPDQTPTVFALVPTPVLAQMHPELVAPDDDSVLSLLAEEALPGSGRGPGTEPYAALEEFLATASWPESVVGAAVVLDIVVLPPGSQPDLPPEQQPERRAARLAVGALRGGPRLALLELVPENPDEARELRTHPDLASDLQDALSAALED
ncbi:PPA1309 family protein [Gordonia sp. DT30]|uniref:PPA1309 family protein n=1 Tax=Gordonia sp. DT30 TaxID=3416546 RepID=UPI003CF8EDFE